MGSVCSGALNVLSGRDMRAVAFYDQLLLWHIYSNDAGTHAH